MEQISGKIYRNKEFLEWVEKSFAPAPQRAAAMMTFNWLKSRYPEILPFVRGEVVDEFTQGKGA